MKFQVRSISRLLAVAGIVTASLVAAGLPPGKQISVRLGQTLASDRNRSGDPWEGTLASDVIVDGNVIAKRGAAVRGTVAEADKSGRLSGTAYLKLRVTSVDLNGVHTPVNTELLTRQGKSHKGRDVKAAGGTAALGAVIGAVAGGGRGAAIGAGAGAAAGTAGAAATGKKDIQIPVETILTFRVQ